MSFDIIDPSLYKLDGRACRFIHLEAMSRINWAQVSDPEKALMRALGVDCPAMKQDAPC